MSSPTRDIAKLQRKIETLENCIVSIKNRYNHCLLEYKKYQNEIGRQDLIEIIMFMDKTKQINNINLQSIPKNILVDVIKQSIETNSGDGIELIKKHLTYDK